MSPATDERLSLPIEQGVLLWCIRVWVADLQQAPQQEAAGAARRIPDMLARLGAAGAAPYFEGFMFALSHGATKRIAVHCICQPKVGADERALLDAFGLAQEARPFEALLLLRQLSSPAAARSALRSAEGLAQAMTAAGRMLPAPDSEVARFAMTASGCGATVH
jgi:hypothetical protein